MTGVPNKRQKREDYRKAQEALYAADGGPIELPKKKFYRQRAHANPFSDHALTYPTSPSEVDWSKHFPAFVDTTSPSTGDKPPQMRKQVEIVDIGCGFGGLLVALSPLFSDTLMIGMELRTQVLTYVTSRVTALRSQHPLPPPNPGPPAPPTPPYHNISALRTNTMKFLPRYFPHHTLTHFFICFPDPHFKARKHKARIISAQLNAEYAYFLKPGGKVYTITDVEELAGWIVRHFGGEEAGAGKELWERVSDEECEQDVCVRVMREETEEGKKVTRNGGTKFVSVWRRRTNPAWPDEG